MRTTLTLDDDIAAKLRSLTRRSDRSLREVVNDLLRRGLASLPPEAPREPFRVEARDLGARRPGVDLDNIAALIEEIEGPLAK